MAALIHVDDPERAEAYSMLVGTDVPRYADLGMREQTFARMLFYALWDDGGFQSYDAGLDYLRGYQFVCSEIRQLVKLRVAAPKHAAEGLGAGQQHVPLLSHATYRREEILAALQYGSLEFGKNGQHREGVAWCPATSTDAFFVTLNNFNRWIIRPDEDRILPQTTGNRMGELANAKPETVVNDMRAIGLLR
jgi:hypothetical protein